MLLHFIELHFRVATVSLNPFLAKNNAQINYRKSEVYTSVQCELNAAGVYNNAQYKFNAADWSVH